VREKEGRREESDASSWKRNEGSRSALDRRADPESSRLVLTLHPHLDDEERLPPLDLQSLNPSFDLLLLLFRLDDEDDGSLRHLVQPEVRMINSEHVHTLGPVPVGKEIKQAGDMETKDSTTI